MSGDGGASGDGGVSGDGGASGDGAGVLTDPAGAPSGALAEPTIRVRPRWTAMLILTNLAIWMGFFTPIQYLLPQQLAEIVPDGKETALAIVTGIGALVALVANPLAGALSDRTTSRFGRRHPWTLAGGLLGALALVFLAEQHTVAGVIVGWIAAQGLLNGMLASTTAAVPDRVPVTQRGAVSGWLGIPQVVGVVLGVALVTMVVHTTRAGYLALAAAVALLTLFFPLFTPDDRLPRAQRPRWSWRAFWVSPREYPDFGWAFATRFIVQLGNALGTLYLLYFLRDGVRLADPDGSLLIVILIYTAGIIATAVLSGLLSDRTGKRKILVAISGVVMAIAAVLLAFFPTWTWVLVAAFVFGAGYGIYVGVDSALITQVLPAAQGRAKDLGIINIANSAPQVLGPVIAAPVVTGLGGYPVLYALTALVTLLGAVLVYRIRSVA